MREDVHEGLVLQRSRSSFEDNLDFMCLLFNQTLINQVAPLSLLWEVCFINRNTIVMGWKKRGGDIIENWGLKTV